MENEDRAWETLSYEEKNHRLFLRQKALLDSFLEHGAITPAQHDKSLRDLTEKMGENRQTPGEDRGNEAEKTEP